MNKNKTHFFNIKNRYYLFLWEKLILLRVQQEALQHEDKLEEMLSKEYFTADSTYKIPTIDELIRRRKYGVLALFLTYNCNLKCKYCVVRSLSKTSLNRVYKMNSAILFKSIDFFFNNLPTREKVQILYFGGEPLLEFNLLKESVEYIKKIAQSQRKEVSFSISTNGTLLVDKKIANYLRNNKFNILISIDGPKYIHDKYRVYKNGRGSFENVMKGIKNLKNYPLFLRSTLADPGVPLKDIISFLSNINENVTFHIEPLIEGYQGKINCDEFLSLQEKEIDSFFEIIIEDIKKTFQIRYPAILTIFKSLLTRKPRLFSCGFGQGIIAIGPDGDIYGCETGVGYPNAKIGNIFEGIIMDNLRKLLHFLLKQREKCKNCWAQYLCGGGCPLGKLWIGEEEYHKWHCNLIRKQIEYTLYLFDFLRENSPEVIKNVTKKLRLIKKEEVV